jgi:hypothetical protein
MFKQISSKSNKSSASNSFDDIATLSINTAVGTNLAPSPSPSRSSSRESPFKISQQLSLFTSRFEPKNDNGEFLGETSNQRDSLQYCQFIQTSSMARSKFQFTGGSTFTHNASAPIQKPSESAIERTKLAASGFFSLAYQVLDKNNEQFPLAGKNKCLGMVAVPGTRNNLVMIAISQDKDPANDVDLRNRMVQLLNQINQTNEDWVFELACIPTKSQYMMPRTLFTRTTHPAPSTSVTPRTSCVEVALMVALNKIGRHVNFTSEDAGVMAFGGTMWTTPWCVKNSTAVPHFEGAERNTKYTTKEPIFVDLGEGKKGWINRWDPCGNHCELYMQEMLAIGASGGPATSFTEPRSERHLPPRIQEQTAAMASSPK